MNIDNSQQLDLECFNRLLNDSFAKANSVPDGPLKTCSKWFVQVSVIFGMNYVPFYQIPSEWNSYLDGKVLKVRWERSY
mgnify:CR=1 FL=1